VEQPSAPAPAPAGLGSLIFKTCVVAMWSDGEMASAERDHLSHLIDTVASGVRGGYIQTDATVHQGSSGGPLLDASGGVCGVVTQTHEAKDISFAIYADTILDVLEERHAATAAAD